MNDRPRRKRDFPKGFPVETDLEAMQKARIVQRSVRVSDGSLIVSWSGHYEKSAKQGPQMIRRAYKEPLGFNLIENILLQRNYIID